MCMGTFRYEHTPCSSEFFFKDNDTGERVAREWQQNPLNFDNVLNATLLLFVAATGEGWPDIMYRVFVIGASVCR